MRFSSTLFITLTGLSGYCHHAQNGFQVPKAFWRNLLNEIFNKRSRSRNLRRFLIFWQILDRHGRFTGKRKFNFIQSLNESRILIFQQAFNRGVSWVVWITRAYNKQFFGVRFHQSCSNRGEQSPGRREKTKQIQQTAVNGKMQRDSFVNNLQGLNKAAYPFSAVITLKILIFFSLLVPHRCLHKTSERRKILCLTFTRRELSYFAP